MYFWTSELLLENQKYMTKTNLTICSEKLNFYYNPVSFERGNLIERLVQTNSPCLRVKKQFNRDNLATSLSGFSQISRV